MFLAVRQRNVSNLPTIIALLVIRAFYYYFFFLDIRCIALDRFTLHRALAFLRVQCNNAQKQFLFSSFPRFPVKSVGTVSSNLLEWKNLFLSRNSVLKLQNYSSFFDTRYINLNENSASNKKVYLLSISLYKARIIYKIAMFL